MNRNEVFDEISKHSGSSCQLSLQSVSNIICFPLTEVQDVEAIILTAVSCEYKKVHSISGKNVNETFLIEVKCLRKQIR
jgi:hypothetical protein